MNKLKNFYVVEGIDGSGKSTFCNGLQLSLAKNGIPCMILSESDDPAFSKLIRGLLKDNTVSPLAEAYAFAAARANCIERMKLFLKNHPNGIVIFDRYIPSSLVYQTEKVPVNEVKHINENFPMPEVVFWLDLDVDVALSRIGSRSEKAVEKYEKADLLKKWKEKYTEVLTDRLSDLSYFPAKHISSGVQIGGLALSNYSPKEIEEVSQLVRLDASKEPDEIIDEAFEKYNILK